MLNPQIRDAFELDFNWTQLNHGSFGAVPKAVAAAQHQWQHTLEQCPDWFLREQFPYELQAVQAIVADQLCCQAQTVVFVTNVSTAVSTVLNCLPSTPNQVWGYFDTTYPSVKQAMAVFAKRYQVQILELTVPLNWDTPATLINALEAQLGGTQLQFVVLDHIVSATGCVMPIQHLSAFFKQYNTTILVDAAHSMGQLDIDLSQLEIDFFTTNFYKWGFVPRGTAALWIHPLRQDAVHPLVITHGYPEGLHAFSHQGTQDVSPVLSIPAALSWVNALGVTAIRQHNQTLLQQALAQLMHRWQTEAYQLHYPQLAMGLVPLPLCDDVSCPTPTPTPNAQALFKQLLRQQVVAPVLSLEGRLYLRLCAQVYNQLEDYLKLLPILAAMA